MAAVAQAVEIHLEALQILQQLYLERLILEVAVAVGPMVE
jgi:hypothetical protein